MNWLYRKIKRRQDCQNGKCERVKEQRLKEGRQKLNRSAVSDDVKREQRLHRQNKVGQPYRRITSRAHERQRELTQTWPHKHMCTNTARAKFHERTYLPRYNSVAIPQSDHLRFIQSHLIQTLCLHSVQCQSRNQCSCSIPL